MKGNTATPLTGFLAELSVKELEALARDGFVTKTEAIEPSREFPDFEEGSTAADVATAKREEAAELESGNAAIGASARRIALAHDAKYKRRHERVCEERHLRRIPGLAQPALPQPPEWAVAAERRHREELRDIHGTRARTLRSEARNVIGARRGPERQPRARGAGRPKVHSSARRSSERSGDSGADDGESEPSSRRLCQLPGCDRDLPPRRRKYCCDQHADAARKRAQRRRDRTEPERVADRGYALAIKRALAAGVAPHILCTHEEHRGFELHSPDDDVFCGLCGRWVGAPTASVNGYDATRREMERLDERATGARGRESWQLPRRRRHQPWPDRTFTDPSIVRGGT